MQIESTPLPGVVILTPVVFEDPRGFFLEWYNAKVFREHGLPEIFVQDNHSRSSQGTLRGLHYQYPHAQGKLVRVITGEVFDVAVDVRRNSPTFAKWFGCVLSESNRKMMYLPEGFAHGFCVLSDTADFVYKCTRLYAPEYDAGLLWNDPDLQVQWPIREPKLSLKDAEQPRLRDIAPSRLPPFRPPPEEK